MTLLDLRPGAGKKASAEPDVPARVFPQPLSSVFSDLLPDEVRTSRRLAYLKRRMAFVLLALALVIGLGDALARQQTSTASDDLATANLRINALNLQANRYAQVVGVQNETQQITTLLTSAMAGDLPWAALTSKLQALAPSGLTLTGVDGSVGSTNAAPAAAAPASGAAAVPTVVGTLSLTGTTPSLRAVADYVTALVSIRGLTAVNPATATGGSDTKGSLTFTITASLTSAAQGGRFTPGTPSTGSSTGTPTAAGAGAGAGSAPAGPATGGTPAPNSAPAGN